MYILSLELRGGLIYLESYNLIGAIEMKRITILLALMFAVMQLVQAQDKPYGIILTVKDYVKGGCWTSPKQLELNSKVMLEQHGFRVFDNGFVYATAITEGSVMVHPFALGLELTALGNKHDSGCVTTFISRPFIPMDVIPGYNHTDGSRTMVDMDGMDAGLIAGSHTYVSNKTTEHLLEYTARFIGNAKAFVTEYNAVLTKMKASENK